MRQPLECILFGTKRQLGPDVNFEIKLDNTVVNRVTSVKYLCIYLDQYLDFSKHVEGLLKKACGTSEKSINICAN